MMPRPLFLAALAMFLSSGSAQTLRGQEPAVYGRRPALAMATDSRRDSDPAVVTNAGGFPSLTHPSQSAVDQSVEQAVERNRFAAPAVTVTSSLAVVLGLFAALVWIARKYGSRSIAPGAIPRDVLESLGSTAIDSRTRVTMLRCGGRILVLAQTAAGIQPLSEISDPEEVRQVTAACLGDAKRSFATTLQSIEKEKPAANFVGDSQQTVASPRSRGQLFATA